MIKGEDEDFDEIRRRLARVELIASIALIGSNGDWDKETAYFLRRYLRDLSEPRSVRQGGRYLSDFPEFDFLLDRLLSSSSSRSSRFERDISSLQRQQSQTTESSERQLGELSARLAELASSFEEESKRTTDLSAGTHEWLAVQSLGLDTADVRMTRFVPLRVFLSETPREAVADVSEAVKLVLDAFGFDISDEFAPIIGSWFKKWFAKTVDIATQPEVLERLEKIERAVELKGLGQPQADIDAKQSEAVSCLLKAVENIPNAAVQVGSILLVKITSSNIPQVQVRTLTQRELIHLENNQKLLKSPANILDRLTELCRPPEDAPAVERRRTIKSKRRVLKIHQDQS
jgi:hypothetical protein